jgi:hypothetical protein
MKIAKFQNGFFDRLAVTKSVEEATRKALSKAGAFVRQSAKTSLRYRNKASKPGQPPSVHRGSTIKGRSVSLLKEMIFFAYDARTRSVVIGPALLNSAASFTRRTGKSVPQILEEGGEIKIVEVFHRGRWKPASVVGSAKARSLPQRLTGAKIEARPFMVPAMVKNINVFPGLFKSSMPKVA